MTNEEAIKELQSMCDHLHAHGICDKDSNMLTACKMAISALEQKPCEDAISREDAEQMFRNIRCHLKPQDYKSAEEFNTRDLMLLNAEQMIHALPSVTQKSGKWIKRTDRLPEDKTYVLTTIKVPNRVAHARSGWYECGFFHNDNGDTWRATDMEVKAWMPLPEPYKGE